MRTLAEESCFFARANALEQSFVHSHFWSALRRLIRGWHLGIIVGEDLG